MRSTIRLLLSLSLLFSLVAQPAHAQPIVIFVNDDATGANNGAGWANAYTSLQSALAAASTDQEIWVASGSYRPAGPNGDRNASFVLKNGVAIYGGFAGSEIARSQRDWVANVVTLTGDLNGDDGANFANTGENSYNVVEGATGATLDGFTITGGNANGNGCFTTSCGGGILNRTSSPTLINLIIRHNQARFGGGIENTNGSSPSITNVVISHNVARFGGGMENFSNSNPTLTNVVISHNNAIVNGGGIYGPSTQIRNSIIWGNTGASNPNMDPTSITNISHSLVQGSGGSSNWNSDFGIDGGNNLDADPLFADPSNGDYRLRPGSPALNSGRVTNAPPNDIRGILRPQGSGVEMGVFEMRPFSLSVRSGTPQSTPVGEPFAQALTVTVGETGGNPVPNIPISFSAPSSGPSAILGSPTVSTTLSGTASVTASANLIVGSYSITATATGVGPASFSLHNAAQTQTISFAQPPNASYGDPPIELSASTSSGLPVSFSSSTPSICSITGSSTTILGAGICTIVATQAGNSLYAAAPPITRTITIIPKALAISADDTIRSIGQPNPSFSVRYTGLVNGETSSVLSGTLSLSTTATAASPPGSYPITPSGLTSSNYAIVFVPGTLTVTDKQIPFVVWAAPPAISYGTPLSSAHLNAVANVPGSFRYSPALGTRLNAGNGQALQAMFTPSDSTTYAVLTTTMSIDVTRAPLTISANDATRTTGQPNPSFSVRYTGLVNGETSNVLSGTLSISTTATAASPPGSYPIFPSGLTSSNYALVFVPGTLTVTAAVPAQRRVFVPLVQQ
jgi:hypothetical protein